MKRIFPKWLLSFVLFWLVPGACAQSATPTFPNPGKAPMSREEQHTLGLQAAAHVYEQMPVLPDNSPETQYVRQLGHKLVSAIPPQYSWPFEFHVVAQKEINAFALPGGPMFINIGTITASSNEAELAGVMAHEMSHVYMQHSAKQAGKAQTTSMIAGIAGAVLGGTVGSSAGGMVGQLGQMGIQVGAQGLMLKYSRGDESQADAVGAMILYKAGYNPQAMADFFKTLQSQGGQAPPQWLSDHPNPGNRQQAIQKEISNWPTKSYVGDSPDFQRTRQHARGVQSYTGQEIAQGAKSGQWAALNKKNGASFRPAGGNTLSASSSSVGSTSSSNAHAVSLQSVLPNQHMVNADLGPLKMQRPENWQVTLPQQRGQFATIAPRAGITSDGVGYGVLLNGVAPPSGGRMSIDEVTGELIQHLHQNNGLDLLGNPQTVTVGGIQGRSAILQATSPFPNAKGQAQKERDWLVTVPQHDGTVLFILFIAPQSEFERFQPTYAAMLKSVRF